MRTIEKQSFETGKSIRIAVMRVVAVFVIFQHGLAAQPAWCCSCVPFPVEEHFRRADVVFAGRVIERRAISRHYHQFTFQVQQSWKGFAHEPMIVFANPDGSSCGFSFEIGRDYLVYASMRGKQSPRLETGLCAGTELLINAEEDLFYLQQATIRPSKDTSNLLLWSVGVAISLALAASVVTVWWILYRPNPSK